MQSLRFFTGVLPGGGTWCPAFCIPEVIENKRVKKSLLNVKIPLDKILFCDRISLVEKCAPAQVGAFCFYGQVTADPAAEGLLVSTPKVLKTKELSAKSKALANAEAMRGPRPVVRFCAAEKPFFRTRTPR